MRETKREGRRMAKVLTIHFKLATLRPILTQLVSLSYFPCGICYFLHDRCQEVNMTNTMRSIFTIMIHIIQLYVRVKIRISSGSIHRCISICVLFLQIYLYL